MGYDSGGSRSSCGIDGTLEFPDSRGVSSLRPAAGSASSCPARLSARNLRPLSPDQRRHKQLYHLLACILDPTTAQPQGAASIMSPRVQSNSRNSATDRFASRMMARSSGCFMAWPAWTGTMVRAFVSGWTNTRWLPRCRSSMNPARWSARTTFRAVRDGSWGMNQRGTEAGTVTRP
jgi:hypothetical protein